MTSLDLPVGACGDTAPTGDPLAPGSPAWVRTITASKVPAILGMSRFQSQFSLWHEMAGLVEPAPVSEQQQELFDYGHAVEVAAAEYWRYRNPGWRLSRSEVSYSDPSLPFPNQVTIDRRASRGRSRRIVEVKSARSLEDWGDDGSGETPADYAAQVITQQHISGITADADLVLWPTYGRPRVYTIVYDREVAEQIIDRCTAWWESIKAGTPPELDDTITTYETLRRLHPDVDRGAEVEVSVDDALELLQASRDEKSVAKAARGAKSRILAAAGSAQYVTCRGVRVADRRGNSAGSVSLYPNTKVLDELKAMAS